MRLSGTVSLARFRSTVSSRMSLIRLRSCDAPLPSSGSRWPRFPAFAGTVRALRLPIPHPSGSLFSPSGTACILRFRIRSRAPGTMQARCWAKVWTVQAGSPSPAVHARGRGRASQVPRRSLYGFGASPRSRTARSASSVVAFPPLPPHWAQRRRQHCKFRSSTAPLHCSLYTLHDVHCCAPCNTRFRLVGLLVFVGLECLPTGLRRKVSVFFACLLSSTSALLGLRLAEGQFWVRFHGP